MSSVEDDDSVALLVKTENEASAEPEETGNKNPNILGCDIYPGALIGMHGFKNDGIKHLCFANSLLHLLLSMNGIGDYFETLEISDQSNNSPIFKELYNLWKKYGKTGEPLDASSFMRAVRDKYPGFTANCHHDPAELLVTLGAELPDWNDMYGVKTKIIRKCFGCLGCHVTPPEETRTTLHLAIRAQNAPMSLQQLIDEQYGQPQKNAR
jgi:hypothetical protein